MGSGRTVALGRFAAEVLRLISRVAGTSRLLLQIIMRMQSIPYGWFSKLDSLFGSPAECGTLVKRTRRGALI